MVRVLNTLLLLIIIVGFCFVMQANTKFEATRSEYARLTAKVGRLPIEDATKVHVLALETGEPLDFLWHIYVPAKFNWKWETSQPQSGRMSSSSGGGMSQASRTELVRVRFRKIDGQWHVWTNMISGSSVGSARRITLLDQPELLEVQRLGVGEVKVIEPDEVATFLSITAKQPSSTEDRATPAFALRFGSQAAWNQPQIKGK